MASLFGGSISAAPNTLENRINSGLSGLFAHFMDEGHAQRLANKATRALNDLTPFGTATGAEAGARQVARGVNHRSAMQTLMGVGQMALAVLPAAPGKVARKAAGPLKELFGGIRAWHGSPHDFDKFDISKIGTGMGRSYGHGVYVSADKEVARPYADRPAEQLDDQIRREIADAGSPEAAAKGLEEWLAQDAAKNGELMTPQRRKFVQDTLQGVRRHLAGDTSPSPRGSLYEVNLRAKPDEFLQYGRAASEQGALSERLIGKLGLDPRQPIGDGLFYNLGEGWNNPDFLAQSASKLRETGALGVAYNPRRFDNYAPDAQNYVVFDPSIIDILNKY